MLLTFSAKQLQRKDEIMEKAVVHLKKMRKQGEEIFDENNLLRTEDFKIGNKVLLHDTPRFMKRRTQNKLIYKWLGPYQIHKVIAEKGHIF